MEHRDSQARQQFIRGDRRQLLRRRGRWGRKNDGNR